MTWGCLRVAPFFLGEGMKLTIAEAIQNLANNFKSENEADRNGEVANIVDGLYYIAYSLKRIADIMESNGATND